MKILFISTLYPLRDAGYATATSALKEIVDQWQATDEVHVVRPLFNGARLPAQRDPQMEFVGGIRVPGLERYFVDTPKLTRRLAFKPGIVVAHMYKSYLWAWQIANHYRVPFVAGIHSSDIQLLRFPHLRPRLHRIFSRADGLACRSPAMRKQILAHYPDLRPGTFCANSGITTDLIQPPSFFYEKVRRLHRSKEIHFATAARLQKCKNVDVTLHALSRLPAEIRWTFRIVGDGPERAPLQALAKRLGLSRQVSFLGWLSRDRVFEELRKSDAFILVSAPETFGLVYLEALAAGNIVIAAKGWGVDGFITDGVNGYLCTLGDRQDLLRTIRKITLESTEAELEHLAQKSHGLISRNTEEIAAQAYLGRLRAICGHSP